MGLGKTVREIASSNRTYPSIADKSNISNVFFPFREVKCYRKFDTTFSGTSGDFSSFPVFFPISEGFSCITTSSPGSSPSFRKWGGPSKFSRSSSPVFPVHWLQGGKKRILRNSGKDEQTDPWKKTWVFPGRDNGREKFRSHNPTAGLHKWV